MNLLAEIWFKSFTAYYSMDVNSTQHWNDNEGDNIKNMYLYNMLFEIYTESLLMYLVLEQPKYRGPFIKNRDNCFLKIILVKIACFWHFLIILSE